MQTHCPYIQFSSPNERGWFSTRERHSGNCATHTPQQDHWHHGRLVANGRDGSGYVSESLHGSQCIQETRILKTSQPPIVPQLLNIISHSSSHERSKSQTQRVQTHSTKSTIPTRSQLGKSNRSDTNKKIVSTNRRTEILFHKKPPALHTKKSASPPQSKRSSLATTAHA